jgi:hypothetical protein
MGIDHRCLRKAMREAADHLSSGVSADDVDGATVAHGCKGPFAARK